MKIFKVCSLRLFLNENYRDIVHEWEDDIEKNIKGIEFEYVNKPTNDFYYRIRRKVKRFFPIKNNLDVKEIKIAFCMTVNECYYFDKNGVILPVIIDLWPKEINIAIRRIRNRIVVITSLDMYKRLLPHCPNIIYMPLCISNRWIDDSFPEKDNTMVQMGRNNPVLHEFAIMYCQKHPNIEYIYAEYDQQTKHLTYYSTINGKIETPKTRQAYMEVLRRAKICLLSSPGIDNTRPMAEGIDYPTPRFYEAAINYCHMLGRYNEIHEEFSIQGIDLICHNIKSYEQFDHICEEILIGKIIINKKKYDAFIERHSSVTWIEELSKKINIDR